MRNRAMGIATAIMVCSRLKRRTGAYIFSRNQRSPFSLNESNLFFLAGSIFRALECPICAGKIKIPSINEKINAQLTTKAKSPARSPKPPSRNRKVIKITTVVKTADVTEGSTSSVPSTAAWYGFFPRS